MQWLQDNERTIGRAAFVAAGVGTVLAPLHALSRHATAAGKEDLELALTRIWAEPAAERLRPLLDWADPDTVYLTYGKGWLFVFLAAALCAFVVRTKRRPRAVERCGWWIALVGYVLAAASVLGSYWTPWLDESFLFLAMPGMLLSLLGSTVLGIALVRRGFRPRATAWVLAGWLPLMIALTNVISLGGAAMPMVWAWGIAGRELGRGRLADATSDVERTPVSSAGR